ncbi:MAG: hypothetical protein GXP28_01325, partial [Planctomycetes bacterium]|nr:hypothetical protein [Planctomycetota bacterium]
MASISLPISVDAPIPQSVAQSKTTDSSEGRRFYYVFLICLALISVPIKNLAYVVPAVFLFLELLAAERSVWRVAFLMAVFTVVSSLSLMADAFLGQAVNVPGLFLALLTYLPLFLFFGMRWDRKLGDRLFEKLMTATAWFVIVQSAIGVVQFALSRNGDAVAGTFGLLDFYLNTISIAQVYFTFTIFGMILFLMIDAKRPIAKIAIVSGLMACAIAHSGHQTIFFVASLAMFSMVQFKRMGTAVRAVAMGFFLVFLMVQIYPETWTHTREWYRKVVNDPRSAKRMVLLDSARFLAHPKNAVLGVGMGQYSSRAALITSNEYLRRQLPDVASAKSAYFSDSMISALHVFGELGEGSAISKPYFSALTILVELGPLLALACLIGILFHFRRNLEWMQSKNPQLARIGWVSCVGLLFFLLCCGIENYAEFPQAIFLPFLLYLAAQSRAAQLAIPPRDNARSSSP